MGRHSRTLGFDHSGHRSGRLVAQQRWEANLVGCAFGVFVCVEDNCISFSLWDYHRHNFIVKPSRIDSGDSFFLAGKGEYVLIFTTDSKLACDIVSSLNHVESSIYVTGLTFGLTFNVGINENIIAVTYPEACVSDIN